MKLGQFEHALASINRALELEPDYATALCFKIDVLQAMGRHDEAQECIRELPPIEYHF
jgi:tetratricopeptide (TPR) repeat protein